MTMTRELQISVGQHSDKVASPSTRIFTASYSGRAVLSLKGIAAVLADGISSSDVSQIASEVGGQELPDGLLLHVGILDGEDLRARVLDATNSWLHAQTRKSQ